MSTLLLSETEYVRAREAVRAGGVSAELYAFLGRLVAVAQATRAMAPAPVPGGRWSDPDAIAETVHAWLAESLLDGGLLQAFDVCQTPRALARYLERALRNWLIGRSRRASGPRLLERSVELLGNDDAFALVRDAPAVADRWWAAAALRNPEPFSGTDGELVAHAWALGDFALLRFSSSERSDPVLSRADLRRYLAGLLERVERAVSGRHLDLSFRARFAYAYEQSAVTLDEAPELVDHADPADRVLIHDAALIAIADLSERQTLVLLERPTGTLEALAAKLSTSRGTVDNEYRRALLKVRSAAPTDEMFDAVLEKVLELASGEDA